jgi:hypothetical protein
MHSTKRHLSIAVCCVATFLIAPVGARTQEMVVGVNVVNPMRASIADQNALLSQLKAAEVHVIRCGISNDDKGIDFAKRAAVQGIRLQLIVGPQYTPNAPTRPYQPKEFPAMWGGHPLSYADPTLSKTAFQRLFDGLDANGIELAGIELGNEINWAAFNPEFPLPGEGKILSVEDLAHDPEGKQIAKGFLQYIKILEVLKDVRDHSRLNKSTPIISAGMVSAEDGAKLYNNKKEDMVSLSASIAFLRAHSLDSLVDAYGVHSYPSSGKPSNPAAAAQRLGRLNSVDLTECRAKGAKDGKPCWITEWGFPNADVSCPPKEAGRTLLIEELRGDFAAAAAEHRLVGIDYFSWDSDPWSKTIDADSVYRCGALTESGREAVAPEAHEKTADLGASIKVRVGTPLVARGPASNIADAAFTGIRLPNNGRFRGFTAAGTSFAIDGKEPYDMGGQAATVLKPGPGGSPDSCGQWINHVELVGKTLYGWVHNETACDYAKYGQTHAMMTIASSTDYGFTWRIRGPIIRGTDPPVADKETGDSCMIAVRFPDGYDYAYCLHNGGHSWDGGYTFAARAPATDPGPGSWKKYYNGSWSQPGVDGKASPLDGFAVAYWTTIHEMIGLKGVNGKIGISASSDQLHFTPILSEPLMLIEPGDWARKNGLELVAYTDLIDAHTGLNQLSDHWLLAYMYLNPGENFGKRYLVFRPVDISWGRAPGEPQVGETLTHWYNKAEHDHWATTAPVPGNWAAYGMVAQLGYMMTAPESKEASTELEECVSQGAGHLDHILIQKGECEIHGYKRLRSAGFVYSAVQPNTQPLYRCYSDTEKSHFAANRDDCNSMGKREALLGYDLKQ